MHQSPKYTRNITIGQRNDIERVAGFCSTIEPYRLPLIRAACDGIINIVHPSRFASIPSRFLNSTSRPVVVIIGDDDLLPTGPNGWACARRIKRWGRGAIVHAAGGETKHYEMALAATIAARRFVFVETCTAHELAWAEFLKPQMGVLCIRAADGLPHPKPLTKREMN